jgi:MFS family permease
MAEVCLKFYKTSSAIFRSLFDLNFAWRRPKLSKRLPSPPLKMIVAGAAMGFYAVGILLFTAVMGLATMMATWQAALIVGAVLGIIALTLITTASKRLKHVNAVPERTIETMKENVQWAKNQIK